MVGGIVSTRSALRQGRDRWSAQSPTAAYSRVRTWDFGGSVRCPPSALWLGCPPGAAHATSYENVPRPNLACGRALSCLVARAGGARHRSRPASRRGSGEAAAALRAGGATTDGPHAAAGRAGGARGGREGEEARPLLPFGEDVALGRQVKAVQRKGFLKRGRFELDADVLGHRERRLLPEVRRRPAARLQPAGQPSRSRVRGAYYEPYRTDNVREGKLAFQSQLLTSQLDGQVMIDGIWSPIYGKAAFLGSTIVHFDLFLAAGFGVVWSATSSGAAQRRPAPRDRSRRRRPLLSEGVARLRARADGDALPGPAHRSRCRARCRRCSPRTWASRSSSRRASSTSTHDRAPPSDASARSPPSPSPSPRSRPRPALPRRPDPSPTRSRGRSRPSPASSTGRRAASSSPSTGTSR